MTDPRVDRTRTALRAAALRLAESHSPREITVSQLTAAACVNRATFYSHYDAVVDVVLEALAIDLDRIRDEERALRERGDTMPREVVRATLERCARHVHTYEGVYRHSLDAAGDESVWRAMRDHFTASLREAIDAQMSIPDGVDPGVAAAFGAHAFVGAIISALRGDVPDDVLISTVEKMLPTWWHEWR